MKPRDSFGTLIPLAFLRERILYYENEFTYLRDCTAYGFLDHSLKEDCATIQSH